MQPRGRTYLDFCTHQGSGQSRSWRNHNCYTIATVSVFGRKNKLTAWATWQVFDEATPVFARYSKTYHSFDPHEDSVWVIERFTCLLYDRASTVEDVNNCWQKFFTNRGQSVDDIPPTRDALVQHIRRAIYQAGYDEIQVLSMTPAPGSKQDKDDLCEFICARLCLIRLNVHFMFA